LRFAFSPTRIPPEQNSEQKKFRLPSTKSFATGFGLQKENSQLPSFLLKPKSDRSEEMKRRKTNR
jgi:hypothetical protein